jgi:hypothetical protein
VAESGLRHSTRNYKSLIFRVLHIFAELFEISAHQQLATLGHWQGFARTSHDFVRFLRQTVETDRVNN